MGLKRWRVVTKYARTVGGSRLRSRTADPFALSAGMTPFWVQCNVAWVAQCLLPMSSLRMSFRIIHICRHAAGPSGFVQSRMLRCLFYVVLIVANDLLLRVHTLYRCSLFCLDCNLA